MFRNQSTQLTKWKHSKTRKPLIIRGARQIGKTYLVEDFGKNNFEQSITIDFEKKPSLRKIFDGDLDITKIILMIEVEFKQKITAGTTLLFFDEIQSCPKALMALRYFFEDLPSLHIIAAGSLLEFEMEKVSFPVGRVEFMFMYPMTFEEFLINSNNKLLLESLPNLNTKKEIPAFIHEKFLELLKIYFIVGGLPEAVKTYINTNSFNDVAKIHDSLFNSFIQDLLKYEKKLDHESLRDLFERIPKNIGKQIKYTKLMPGLTNYKVKTILNSLEKTLLIHKVTATQAHALPLGVETNDKVFKYLFVDIGFMQHICGISANDIMQSKDLLETYEGALCEQFIGQELLALKKYSQNKLYYWSRSQKNSSAEIDYLLVNQGVIFPLEVKTGPTGKLKSLHLFLKNHPKSPHGYVLNSGNIGVIDNVCFFPLYTHLK